MLSDTNAPANPVGKGCCPCWKIYVVSTIMATRNFTKQVQLLLLLHVRNLITCSLPALCQSCFEGAWWLWPFAELTSRPLGWHQAAGTSSCWNIDWFYVDKRLTPSCTSARVFEDEWDVVLVKTKRLHGEVLTHLLFMLFSDVNTRIIRIQTNSNISRSVNKRGSPFQSWLSRSGWTRGWDCDASNDLQVLQKAHKSVFPGKPRTQYILWTHGALMCLVFLQGWWNIVKWTT